MKFYLDNYRRFLFNCKGIVSISDTQKYISNNEFDIKEIIAYLEECIDINDIFNLVNSENFYKGHSLKEKYLLLIQFFNVLHNYSKNLILKYDVYSTKSIKKTTTNIKDCLIHIPNYKNYMLDLLGYIYYKEKSEWYINSERSLNSNVIFAATCILCGYAHQKLTKIMEETNLSEDEGGIECRKTTLLDKENNWICKSCSFSNNFKSINCELCFKPHEIEIRPMNNLKANQWQCNACTMINENNNEFCGVCNSGRKLSKSISISSVNSTRSMDKQKVVLSENLYKNITIDQNKNNQMKRQISFEQNSINRQSSKRWRCTHCTFLNENANFNCETCSMKRDVRGNTKRRNSGYKSAENNMKRSASEHALIKRRPDEWTSTECTFQNKNANLNSENCSMKRDVRGNTKPRNYKYKNAENNMKRSASEHALIKRRPDNWAYKECTHNNKFNKRIIEKPIFYSLNNEGNAPGQPAKKIRRSSSEHDLIEGQPDEWTCTKCTFHNKIENLNCEICSMKRDVRNEKPIFHYLNNEGNVPGHAANKTKRSPENILINQPSHQLDSLERKFINKTKFLNSEDCSKKQDDNVPLMSDANKNRIIKPDNKNNSSHQPSNKQDPNADKTNRISGNPPRNNERALIPSTSTNNAEKNKKCRVCQKPKNNKKHIMCKIRRWFFCINNY